MPALLAWGQLRHLADLPVPTPPPSVQAEAFYDGGIAVAIFDMPVLLAFTMGFILKAVGPGLVVPAMFQLQKTGLGRDQGEGPAPAGWVGWAADGLQHPGCKPPPPRVPLAASSCARFGGRGPRGWPNLSRPVDRSPPPRTHSPKASAKPALDG